MSTAHLYGDSPDVTCTEESPFGYGLAPFVGQKWEAAFKEALPGEMRGVIIRTSFVLGKDGGALESLLRITRLGLGGTVGNGKQGMSWIHEYDMNAILQRGIEDETMTGAYNPSPVNLILQAGKNLSDDWPQIIPSPCAISLAPCTPNVLIAP